LKTKSVLAKAALYAAVSSSLIPPHALAGPAPVTSLGTSSRSTRTDSVLFAARCNGSDWTGGVTAQEIRAGSGTVESAGLWGTASLMDGKDASWPASRLVLSARTAGPGAAQTGISWEWDKLPGNQQTALKTVNGIVDASDSADATAQKRMAFIRGDRTQERSSTPAGPFRNRGSRHGDIVNSKLWYLDGKPSSGYAIEAYAAFRNGLGATRASMLYVGANDGMLHGFDSATGEEKIAYVPEGLYSKLVALTQPSYTHHHYVDGSPFTGDLYLGTPGSKDGTKWRTYLAGFLGAGGRGYFVLDVTDPAAFTAGNAAKLVVMDRTEAHSLDPDVGHIFVSR
jgi:type IV pilus assembly protein PilY1